MATKILALGLSSAGGDWTPLAAVVLGLFQRGHSVRYFADTKIARALRHTGIVVDTVRPERELRSYMVRWNELTAAGAPATAGYVPIVTPLTEWSADSLPAACELVSQFRPDVILSQLLTMELASRLKTETGLPWCFVNPAYYFGQHSVRVIPREAFTELRLSEAVATVLTTRQYQLEAQRHAERLRDQDPVGVACEAIEALPAPRSRR